MLKTSLTEITILWKRLEILRVRKAPNRLTSWINSSLELSAMAGCFAPPRPFRDNFLSFFVFSFYCFVQSKGKQRTTSFEKSLPPPQYAERKKTASGGVVLFGEINVYGLRKKRKSWSMTTTMMVMRGDRITVWLCEREGQDKRPRQNYLFIYFCLELVKIVSVRGVG